MELLNIKRDFTISQILMMMKIIKLFKVPYLTVSKMAPQIGVSVYNPQYQRVVKALIDANAIRVTQVIGSSKIISISREGVRDFIDEQVLIEPFFDYFNIEHICKW